MIGKTTGAIGAPMLATVLALCAGPTDAADRPAAYATMAPVAQYLMDRKAEVALARSAAPPSISDAATVMVLGAHGYETAVKGRNGFVCMVERSWMSPFDSVEFWNPKMRGPLCLNPAAVHSVLPYTVARTSLALAGQTKARMLDATKAAVAKKQLSTPEAGAMSYMMSRQQNLGDSNRAWQPHLMFYVPTADATSWGANLPRSPIMLNSLQTVVPEPETIFMVAAGQWSDGTPNEHGKDHHH